MRRIALLALACLLLISSCTQIPPDEESVISASVTEYREPETTIPEPETSAAPETTIPETEETAPPETEPVQTEPEETQLEDVIPLLPAHLILEVSEKLSEVYKSYTRKTETVTEISADGQASLSEISSELMTNGGNASFRRTSGDAYEEYFLIDGFLCYGGLHGNYRFGGYDIASFSELVGNNFPSDAFYEGSVESNGEFITLKFEKITESGIAGITEMLSLSDEYEITVTKAEFIFVTDTALHMKEKKLTLEATVSRDGEEILSFSLTSHTEQTGINEENDLALPAMTSYVLIPDAAALTLYESALADIDSFWGSYQAFELSESDTVTVSGALDLRISDKIDYAYAKKIGASFERVFDTGSEKGQTRVLTHYNYHHAFSQLNGGSIFVDSTFNSKNFESTLTDPFSRALLSFSSFARIESYDSRHITFILNNEGKMTLVRDILLSSGISAKSLSLTSCDEAKAYITFDENGKVASIGFSISARVTADGKSYTLSRTHTLDVTKRGSAKVKVIYIDVDEEEE